MYNSDDVILKIIDDEHSLNRDDIEADIITFSTCIHFICVRSLTAINHDIYRMSFLFDELSAMGCMALCWMTWLCS